MTHARAAIVIVTFNSRSHIGECLRSALATGYEVIVVDNGSQDGTQEFLRGSPVRVIENPTNAGFARAVNQGVLACDAPCLLLLNPDAILETSIDPLIAACEAPGAGAAGGKLVGRDGSPQRGFVLRNLPTPAALSFEVLGMNRLWPANWVNWNYRCLGVDLDQVTQAEQPAGAFFMFRRDAWATIGGFDEGFFPIWFEDVDFCQRLKSAGYDVWYIPQAAAKHSGGHSIVQISLGERTEYWYRSLLRYSIRHFRSFGRALTCLSVVTGSILRIMFGGTTRWNREVIRIYAGIVGLAFRSIWVREVQFGEQLH